MGVDRSGNTTRSITKTGEETVNEYDGLGRLTKRTFPELNHYEVAYDQYSNVIKVDHCGKTDPTCTSPLTTSAIYDSVWETKPASVTDPMGNVTTITYFGSGNGKGQVNTVTQPPDDNAVSPVWSYAYDGNGRLNSAANPEGEVTTASYGALGVFTGIAIDPSGLNLITGITAHNAQGDPLTVNGPRTDVTDVFTFTYDVARRLLTTIDPLSSVSETIYDVYGRPVKSCTQIANSPTQTCAQSSPGSAEWSVSTTAYSLTGQ